MSESMRGHWLVVGLQHGTPEKPLSPLGEVSYQAYWRSVILQFLADNDTLATISIKDIADKTGMSPHDISATFQRLKMIERDQETGMSLPYLFVLF